MSYAWLETLLMGAIFIAAASFAAQHLAPGFFRNLSSRIKHGNNRVIAVKLVATTNSGACQTKCSACNGCSMANK